MTTEGLISLRELGKERARFEKAEEARRAAALKAVEDGVPIVAVARQAGVTRGTIYNWLREAG